MSTMMNTITFGDWEDEEYGCKSLPNNNKTLIFANAYNGVPQTLFLNSIMWVLLIILFTTLRQQAGDYGRLALVDSNGTKKRWTEVFYARRSVPMDAPAARQMAEAPNSPGPSTSLHRPSNAEDTPLSPIEYDQGIFAWIRITWKLRKEQILLHTGPDAVHYLSFQQHLMIVMAIVTVVSLVVILPVNFLNGSDLYDVNAFGRTTMANLAPDSAWQWVHVIVAIAYIPLIVLIMRRSSGRNAFKKAPTRTIMITNISSNDRNRTVIRNYMQELFPDVTIEDVQLAYNISKLNVRNAEYERALDARIYCEQHRDRDSLEVSFIIVMYLHRLGLKRDVHRRSITVSD